MVTKKFGIDFDSRGGALTLPVGEVSDRGHVSDLVQSKTHEDGWTILAQTHEDYYEWVNNFEALHPTFGKVWGDFENEVFADSEEGFANFYKNHPPEAWDYHDI